MSNVDWDGLASLLEDAAAREAADLIAGQAMTSKLGKRPDALAITAAYADGPNPSIGRVFAVRILTSLKTAPIGCDSTRGETKAVTRKLAIGVVLAGAAIGLAAPALADPPSGSYTRTNGPGGAPRFEVILTPCGTGCLHYERPGLPATGRDFHLQGNRWVTAPDSIGYSMSFDNDSLAGTSNIPSPNVGGGTRMSTDSWTLTKNG